MDLQLDRRRLLGAALAAGSAGVVAPTVSLGAAAHAAGYADEAAAAAAGPPQPGIHDAAPAVDWTDGFLTGNGNHGAIVYGTPAAERIILNQHRLVLPNGTRGVRPPVLADRLERVRDLALAGDYAGAQSTFVAGWSLRWTQPFHPAYELTLDVPTGPHSGVTDYVRHTDFRTGEVWSRWSADGARWRRRTFVSRASNVVVHELQAVPGRTIDVTVGARTALDGVPASVGFATLADADGDTGYLNVRGTYPAGQGAYGYEGVTRVVATGGTVAANGTALTVTGAKQVLLLSRLARYEQAGQWDNRPLHTQLAAIDADYTTLLAAHVARHAPLFERSKLRLDVSAADRAKTTTELIARQNADRTVLDLALLERMFDSGRYHFISSSGILPPRLTGLWAGSWNAAWADDFTTDANVNLQVAGGNILDLPEAMQSYADLMLSQLADWRTNATNLYGTRGLHAPTRTDGEYGHMLHFDNGFPGLLWTGGADWLLYPLVEYYQVTGDADFLAQRLAPALMELALFYEDFLTRVDAAGHVVFVPTYSPENSPSNTGVPLTINATGEVAAGRHALATAVEVAGLLGLQQAPGEGVQRWKALLAKLPPYLINAQGALAEWSWPGLSDRSNHRHVHHLYPAWPLHEINPEDSPALVTAAQRALEIRSDENLSGHGSLHRALAAARLKDGELVYVNLRKILGNNMTFRSLMTSHNPNRETYNADSAHTLPAVLAEALIHSRPATATAPGVLELLPAVPEQLARGTIKGIRGRNRVRVEELTWDLEAGTLTVRLRSAIPQRATLISRRGIATIETRVAVADSPLGPHARVLKLPADQPVRITIALPRRTPTTVQLRNRRSGRVLDIRESTPDGGGVAVQRAHTDAASQRWHRVAEPDGTYRLINLGSGQALTAPSAAGGPLVERPSTGAPEQRWRLTDSGDGFVILQNAGTGLAADVGGGSLDEGAPVIAWPSNAGQNQHWRLAQP